MKKQARRQKNSKWNETAHAERKRTRRKEARKRRAWERRYGFSEYRSEREYFTSSVKMLGYMFFGLPVGLLAGVAIAVGYYIYCQQMVTALALGLMALVAITMAVGAVISVGQCFYDMGELSKISCYVISLLALVLVIVGTGVFTEHVTQPLVDDYMVGVNARVAELEYPLRDDVGDFLHKFLEFDVIDRVYVVPPDVTHTLSLFFVICAWAITAHHASVPYRWPLLVILYAAMALAGVFVMVPIVHLACFLMMVVMLLVILFVLCGINLHTEAVMALIAFIQGED